MNWEYNHFGQTWSLFWMKIILTNIIVKKKTNTKVSVTITIEKYQLGFIENIYLLKLFWSTFTSSIFLYFYHNEIF